MRNAAARPSSRRRAVSSPPRPEAASAVTFGATGTTRADDGGLLCRCTARPSTPASLDVSDTQRSLPSGSFTRADCGNEPAPPLLGTGTTPAVPAAGPIVAAPLGE